MEFLCLCRSCGCSLEWVITFMFCASLSQDCCISTFTLVYYLSLQGASKSVKFSYYCHRGIISDAVKNPYHMVHSVRHCEDQLCLCPPWRSYKCVCHGTDNSDPAFSKTIHFVLRLKPAVSQLQELTLWCHLGASTLGWILLASIR